MNIETTEQLATIRKILQSLNSGWLSMFFTADGSSGMHMRVLATMTSDVHAQLSEAHSIAQQLRCFETSWPDTAELLLVRDTTKPSIGVPDELMRSSLSRAKAVSSLVANACEGDQKVQLASSEDIDDAIWDIHGRVTELLQLLDPLTSLPAELESAA